MLSCFSAEGSSEIYINILASRELHYFLFFTNTAWQVPAETGVITNAAKLHGDYSLTHLSRDNLKWILRLGQGVFTALAGSCFHHVTPIF